MNQSPPPPPDPVAASGRWPRLVLVILAVSLGLRLALVAQGGQYFFGDEGRYDRGVRIYEAMRAGDWATVRGFAVLPEHMLFTWLGAAVTAVQHLLAQLTPYGDWDKTPANVTFTMWLGAAVLSLFSTLNLALTYRLARVAGADETEATWALLLMAASNVAFYYARHLLPYDCALAFALTALVVGLGGATLARAVAAGFLTGLTYGIYNGYWYLVPTAGVAYAFAMAQRRTPRLPALLAAHACGTILALALPVAFGLAMAGDYYWRILREFSGSATQGSFAEGWSLPWEYFWHAEGALGLAIVVATLGAVAWARRRGVAPEPRVAWWGVTLAVAYALLVLGSNVFHAFVLYARTVKPFVPLFCLLGGWALHRLLAGRRTLTWATAAAIVAAGALHFAPHFPRVFPREIEIAVLKNWGNPKHTITSTGSIYFPLGQPVTRPDLILVNAQMLYPVHVYIGYPPGRTLFRFEHPLSYLPFQYECHDPAERASLRAHDISIRLIALDHPEQIPDDLPERLRAMRKPPPPK